MNDQPFVDQALQQTIEQLRQAVPVNEGGEILYPGERSLRNRSENLIKGVPVHDSVWETVKKLARLEH
jgi:3-dehydro-L-gulonate 2-dehydrogenase